MADKKQAPRTVFVRGVDATVTDAQLQEFFSEVGPVKNAFLVRKGGKEGVHRGFGFVQFAVQEDAAKAAADLNGIELAGRKLKVEGAVKRAPLEERKKRKLDAAAAGDAQPPAGGEEAAAAPAPAAAGDGEQPKARPAKKPRAARKAVVPRDAAASAALGVKHKWLRAVAVGGLTAETLDAAKAMARAAGQVEEIIRPVPDKLATQFLLGRDGCTGDSFLAVYSSISDCLSAVAKLHGQTAGGAGQSQAEHAGKKGKTAAVAGPGCRLWARQLSGEGLHQKRWRLIVRNLPFTATETDLRTAFSPAGFVWELTLPRSAGGRGRGFAFVGFTCKAHAERGIKLVNGQTVAGRPVAVDWAVAKAQFDTQQAAAAEGEEAEGDGGKGTASLRQQAGIDGMDSELEGDSSSDEEGQAGMGREEEGEGAVARPGSLAPEQERSMMASVIDGILDSGDESGGGSEDEEDEEEGSEEDGEGESGSEEEEGGSSEDDDTDSEEEEEEEEEAAAGGAAPDPFSRKQLQQKAGAAAAAAAAQGADPQQQRPPPEEGATVFIRGLPLDVSKDQVFTKMKVFGPVRSCRLVVDKDSGKLKGTAFVDFYKRASSQAAADACAKGRRKEGPGVVIAGLVAEVDMALGHEDVRALALSKVADRGPRDSRRLGLAKEGQIAEGSPAWEDMSAGDQAKRKRAAEEKKLKLKSPNFVVSDTRLSVRNVPHAWSEKQLKAAFIAAVKERASKAQPVVKQAKILMDEERTNSAGAPLSKGIGFVEFTEAEHALCALRQLNNNPTAFNKERRPIVEFALENVKALKLREAKMARSHLPPRQEREAQAEGAVAAAAAAAAVGPQQRGAASQQPQRGGEGGGDEDGEDDEGPKSKRQLRKQRRVMLQERRRKAAEKAAEREAGGGAGGGEEGAANGTPAADDKSKSAKRREQRKRKQQEEQGGAQAAAPAPAAPKPAPMKQQQQQQPAKQQQSPGTQQKAAAKPGPRERAAQKQQGKQPAASKQQAPEGKQQAAPKQQGKQQQAAAKPAAKQQGKQQPASKQQAQEGKQQPVGKQPAQQGKQQPAGKQQTEQNGKPQGKQAAQQRPPINSTAVKGVVASQKEQQAHRRKRSADELIDKLAEGPQGSMQQKKSKKEQTDSVDALAKQYLKKFFDAPKSGGKAGAGGGKAVAAAAASMKRWFD